MKTLITAIAVLITACTAQNITARIYDAAAADTIDLDSLPITADAIASIQEIYDLDNVSIPAGVTNGDKFDVHAHLVAPWYRIVAPTVGQIPTPVWTLEAQLDFMAGAGIKHSVLSIGAPGSVVFPGSRVKSAALARLLNEYLAAVKSLDVTYQSCDTLTPRSLHTSFPTPSHSSQSRRCRILILRKGRIP